VARRREQREAPPASPPFADVAALSRRGALRAGLRALAAALLLVPAWAVLLGPRPVLCLVLVVMLIITCAAEVALERRAAAPEWRRRGAAVVLALAWAAPLIAQAHDGYIGVALAGGTSGQQMAAAMSAFRLHPSADNLAFHGSVLALATPVVASACARLWARAPGVRTTLHVGRGMLAAVTLAGIAVVLHLVARLLGDGPTQELIAVLGAIFFGVVLLSPVTMLLGQLAAVLEERLTGGLTP
jgi:hypothetical protein